MTQPTIDWIPRQHAARDAMSTADLGPEITSHNELDGMTSRGIPPAMPPSSTFMNALELKIPPPIVGLVLALLMWLTPAVAGLAQIPSPARVIFAIILVGAGQSISIAGMLALRRAKTTMHPVKASLASSLVVRGVYRYTRNPMYVGLLLTLLAWAVLLANPFAAPWVVVYALYITRFQIIPEERLLVSLFGAEYEVYKGGVPRWLGNPFRARSPSPRSNGQPDKA